MNKWLGLGLVSGALFFSCQHFVRANGIYREHWDKPKWIGDALKSILQGRYPRVRAISYWHEIWRDSDGILSDLRLNSSNEAAATYKDLVKNPHFITQPQYLFTGGMYALDVPETGIYLSAFPGFGATEDLVSEANLRDFEAIAGHPVVWAYFSNNWFHGIQFPQTCVDKIHKVGRVPFIRMMMRSEDGRLPDSHYSLQQIIEGRFDPELTKWAEEAKLTRLPLMVEFGTEVNGDWFPWNGKWNGGGVTDDFGDPTLADGPERFQAAYRHIVNLFRRQEASNVSWVYHVTAQSSPNVSWNSIASYYPGDDFVDWIGVSVYGPQKVTDSAGESFSQILDRAYTELTALSPTKPIAVLEWGITEPARQSVRQRTENP